jgi:FkbM family methyltransferase
VRVLAATLRALRRANLRGQTLLTLLLARRLKALQSVAISIGDWPPIYMDMRAVNAHSWLLGTPFESSPLERDEQAVMRRSIRSGDVAFDIGANFGLHTVLLSRLVGPGGRVVAFEANPELIPMLERTIEGLGNVTLYSCALSDRSSDSVLFVPDDHSMGSLVDWTTKEPVTWGQRLFRLGRPHTVSCRQRPLDEIVGVDALPPPAFVKCDVEGAELMVFKGGQRTLDRPDAPVILFEAIAASARSFAADVSDAAAHLARLPQPQYRFLAVSEGGALREVQPGALEQHNIVAVPRSRRGLFPELAPDGLGR